MSDSVKCPACGKVSCEKFCGECGFDLQGEPWERHRRHLEGHLRGQSIEVFAKAIWEACETHHGIMPKGGF